MIKNQFYISSLLVEKICFPNLFNQNITRVENWKKWFLEPPSLPGMKVNTSGRPAYYNFCEIVHFQKGGDWSPNPPLAAPVETTFLKSLVFIFVKQLGEKNTACLSNVNSFSINRSNMYLI